MTDHPLVVHGNFCVYCCIAFGWCSDTILSQDDDFDDDPDELAGEAT